MDTVKLKRKAEKLARDCINVSTHLHAMEQKSMDTLEIQKKIKRRQCILAGFFIENLPCEAAVKVQL